MNEPHHSPMTQLDQPGYSQFYSNPDAEAAWDRKQMSAGNRLIGLGIAGLLFLLGIWMSVDVLR